MGECNSKPADGKTNKPSTKPAHHTNEPIESKVPAKMQALKLTSHVPKCRDSSKAVRDEPELPLVTTIEAFQALLKSWYDTDYHGFKTKFTAAMAAVTTPPFPAGTDPNNTENWKNSDFAHLQDFFNRWYAFYPSYSKGNGLEFIQKFSWIYVNSPVGLNFVTTYPGTEMCRQFVFLNGAKMDDPASVKIVEQWESEIGEEEMSNYIIPPGGYANFNEFFRRELKPGRRPTANPIGNDKQEWLVSPADAVLNMIDDSLTLNDKNILVKTQQMSVNQLLNGSKYAPGFVGGTALSCVLMPDVYHRYHSPANGTVVESDQDVMENYFGIPDFPAFLNEGNVGYGETYSMFENFRRGYLIIKTEKFGNIAMIPVGLNTISSVIFGEKFKKVTSDKPVEITKGEEVGYFQYGGSLCILLFEKNRFPAIRVLQGETIGYSS